MSSGGWVTNNGRRFIDPNALRKIERMRIPPVLLMALAALTIASCAEAPYTHRSQLIMMPESQEIQLGVSAYRETLGKAVVVHDDAVVGVVRRVGERIAAAADKPEYKWEFNVIDDDSMINAFALPGGKVAVYTGLFPVAQDEAGLAAVLGHEVGHALARHGAERMSQGILAQLGGVALSVALGARNSYASDAVMQAYGLGAQYGVLLPYSRTQESEADHIGLIVMAKAGYDPEASLALWQRMEELDGKAPPELLSTHPSSGTRQQDIRGWLPEAQRYYHPDLNVVIAKLPTVSDLEAGRDHGEAACERYARTINGKASGQLGARVMTEALGTTLELSTDTVERRVLDSHGSIGEVAVASALSKSGAGSYEDVIANRHKGEKWSAITKENDQTMKAALGLLRSTLVAARSIGAKYRRQRAG